MSAKIHIRHAVTVIELAGRIGMGGSGSLLEAAVQTAIKQGAINLIIDLGSVTYMDSTGISELAAAYKLARNHRCEFKLLHLPPRIEDLMRITHLASTFDIYTDELEAVTTFHK